MHVHATRSPHTECLIGIDCSIRTRRVPPVIPSIRRSLARWLTECAWQAKTAQLQAALDDTQQQLDAGRSVGAVVDRQRPAALTRPRDSCLVAVFNVGTPLPVGYVVRVQCAVRVLQGGACVCSAADGGVDGSRTLSDRKLSQYAEPLII
jgi:hypothetical protein